MLLIGVDEAGRGAWAGPLVAAAVLIDDKQNYDWSEITDSKQLSKKQRERSLTIIQRSVSSIGIGWVHANSIDKVGLNVANRLAMERAVSQVNVDNSKILIDGNIEYIDGSEAIIGGDALIPCISAASIVAKVMRDRFMCILANKYPNYGFEKHVGYGTAVHRIALSDHGVTNLHRRSFTPIKNLLK